MKNDWQSLSSLLPTRPHAALKRLYLNHRSIINTPDVNPTELAALFDADKDEGTNFGHALLLIANTLNTSYESPPPERGSRSSFFLLIPSLIFL